MGVWYKQLGLLLWKNFLIQSRRKLSTLFEILLPIFFVLILLILRITTIKSKHHDDPTLWKPFQMNRTIPLNKNPDSSSIPNIVNRNPYMDNKPFYTVKKWSIAYAPNNSETRFIMSNLKTFLDANVDAFESPEEMIKNVVTDEDQPIASQAFLCAVTFTSKQGAKQIEYDLRFPTSARSTFGDKRLQKFGSIVPKKWYTQFIYPITFPGINPRNEFEDVGGPPPYYHEGFLSVQNAVNMAIIKSKAKDFNETLYDIQLQRFPYPDGWRDNFIIVIQSSLPLLLMLSLVYSALVITKNVVHEKERKLKESMKMMGLSNWLHWAAWFIKCFVFLLIPMFICSLMLCLSFSSNGRKMLNHSDGYLIFIFLMLYATSGIMFCFFVSTLFYRANIAAAGAGVLWFLTYIPYFFLYNYWFTMSVKSKILACLDFQVAMSFGSYLIGQFEGQGQGVQWSNINQGVTIDDEFTFGHVLMMQVVDIIFYGLLTWYIEGVFPGEYGIPKKFYFPFSKKYWCNVQDFDEERIALTDCDDLENNRKAGEDDSFEEYPEDRKIGIQIQNLRKTFKTEAGIKQAVDDLSLNLYEGEITALLGHNGAGKTTTISMLTGLFPPTSGNAVVNGYDIIYNMDKIRGSLGICPQHNVLFDTLTVEEHLIFFATLKGMKSKQKIEEEVNRMIESIGLSDKRNAESRNLSGGMKRKLSVGNALIGDSKVVILDEPTSGMDVGARRFTWDLLQRERRGRTILLTTHFMDEADVLGDRIAIMASGKVQCYGSSLFLKKRYGVGYHMVMVKTPTCDPSQVQNLIENYVPTAQLESNIGLELSFILPSEYSNKFEELFTEIESNREELGIASYGASVTTLEEVFIKVGEEQDTQESRSHTALFRQLSGKDQDSTNGTALPTFDAASIPFYQPTYEKNTGWTLFFQRWKAMFYKKILHSKRHKWSLIAQLVVPTINVLLGLIVVRTFPNATASPPLAMNLGMFTKDQYIPYCSSTTSRICTNRTPFYNAFAKTLHTESNHAAPNSVNDGFNVTQYILMKERRDLARFNLQYPVGFEAQQVGNQKYRITGWFNNEALHTSAVTLNLLANILLANFTNNEFTIKSRNYPLPPTTSQSTTDTRMNPVGFQIGLNQNFGMAFVAASFIVFLVQERSSKAKHLQFVSGVDPISYWTSSYLWDMINFMLPCLSIIILFAVFQQEGYKGESLGYIMILFITYGWAVIPMMYIFSYLFQVASTAFVRMTILNILTGLATLLVVYILSIPSIGLVDVAHALKWAFLIFPNYNLGQAMIDLFNNYEFKHVFESEDPVAMCTQFLRHVPGAGQIPSQLIKQMCNESLLSYDSSIGRIDVPTCIKDDLTIFPNQKLVTQLCNGIQNFLINATSNFQYNYLAWDNPGIGRYLIFLALEGFIFFGIVLMIEYRVVGGLYIKIRSSLARLCNCSPVYVPTRDDCYFDADVTNEKTRIDNQVVNNHVLMMKNLTKVFHPRSGEPLLAVDHLSLGIPHGECFGLLGQNGAGKTTTFKILTGDETMTSGSASIDGFDVFRDVAEVRQRMGYCPQFDALIDLMTGRELLWMYCRLRGVPEQAISDTVNKLAKDLSVYEHIDKCTKTYSGGNKRKLSTAIALCGDPTLIFLDEPSSGMDPVARRMLWNSLSQVIVSGKSIVITSHSMEECEALCTRLAIMVNGQFKCLGSAQHLKNKFGEGYTLIAKVGGMNFDTLPLRHFIQATFPGSLLKDEHQGYIHYQLKTDQSWAQLFGIMERAKQQYNIEDYSVSQTTLEQVFLNFTRAQREAED